MTKTVSSSCGHQALSADLERPGFKAFLATMPDVITDEELAPPRDLPPVEAAVADQWGALNVPDQVPTVDGLLAATALVHDLTLVTRNVRNVERTGVRSFDPFRR